MTMFFLTFNIAKTLNFDTSLMAFGGVWAALFEEIQCYEIHALGGLNRLVITSRIISPNAPIYAIIIIIMVKMFHMPLRNAIAARKGNKTRNIMLRRPVNGLTMLNRLTPMRKNPGRYININVRHIMDAARAVGWLGVMPTSIL